MSGLPRLSEKDYLLFEEAISSSAQGRAFLRQRDKRSRVVALEEIRRLTRRLTLVRPSLQSTPPQSGEHIRILRQELQEMSGYIQQTRQEIAALRPIDAGNNRILSATSELDAIVSATERATSDILNGAERIQVAIGQILKTEETKQALLEIEGQTIEIMMACSFQDITGQRTTKVVNTLRYIEKRINSMIEIWGVEGMADVLPLANEDTRPDAHLLNGPSLGGGVSQGDVDAFFDAVSPTPLPASPEPVAPPAAAAAPIANPTSAPASTEVDQDAIDKLFA